MREPAREPERDLLFEAFLAGWQAALAMKITHPRVLAVIESCFEGWLLEAADEVEVLGLPFRRREELPHLARPHAPERSRGDPAGPNPAWVPVAAFDETPVKQGWTARPAT